MTSIVDERGYNQAYSPSYALQVRTERRALAILNQMEMGSHKKILELGCGTGELAYILSTKTKNMIIGTDISEKFITQARQNFKSNNLSFEIMDLSNSDLLAKFQGQFDYIVGNGILHHLYDSLDEVLPSLKGLLSQEGKLIFWEPNYFNPYVFLIFTIPILRKLAKLEPDEMAFSRRWILSKLVNAGFQQCSVEYRDFLLPNTPSFLIRPIIGIGSVLEKMPPFKYLSQSVFITAKR